MEKIIMDLKRKIEGYKLPEGVDVIPPFSSIKVSKEVLYNKYSGAVTTYNNVCSTLSKLQFSSITVDRLARELPNTTEVFSKQKLYANELRNMKEEVKGLIDSYKYLKDGLEASVRFYHSLQFIINSPRMEEI